jgi:hypothetical protein
MSAAKGVTARTPHSCETCDRKTANGDWTKSILPGHRYLLHTAFPGDDGFDALERPFSVRECGSCAIERDDFVAHSFGICGTYCHGTNPCVLPFDAAGAGFGHNHVCKWDIKYVASDLTSVDTRPYASEADRG